MHYHQHPVAQFQLDSKEFPMSEAKTSVQEQFGANATRYINSPTHANSNRLTHLVGLVQPQPHWHTLDIATAAGHTAFAFAPHVAQAWATDITSEMLEIAKQQANERGLTNVTVEYADAEKLPYADASFDLVTCRIAPHHFPNIGLFLQESARVLRSGGILAVVDNFVPDGAGGDYVNAFEKLRDPSHGRCLSVAEWLAGYEQAGLHVQHHETLNKSMDFAFWAQRHDAVMQRYLRAMLSEVTGEAKAFLQPQTTPEGASFQLYEVTIIGQKADFARQSGK